MSPAPQRLHLLFTLLLCAALIQLATLVFAAVDHNAAFPGYQEKHACEDELDAETCDSYVYANMCDTGYIRAACQLSCDACSDR
mmetsp:Transcript_19698/g.50427  ORF Transcript_19698/g.50427 Transcript_19698/m.50427 type:complete len:84 (-) Transcript_19698:220-471(-)